MIGQDPGARAAIGQPQQHLGPEAAVQGGAVVGGQRPRPGAFEARGQAAAAADFLSRKQGAAAGVACQNGGQGVGFAQECSGSQPGQSLPARRLIVAGQPLGIAAYGLDGAQDRVLQPARVGTNWSGPRRPN